MGFISNIYWEVVWIGPCSAVHVPAPGIPTKPTLSTEHGQDQGDLETSVHFTLVMELLQTQQELFKSNISGGKKR